MRLRSFSDSGGHVCNETKIPRPAPRGGRVLPSGQSQVYTSLRSAKGGQSDRRRGSATSCLNIYLYYQAKTKLHANWRQETSVCSISALDAVSLLCVFICPFCSPVGGGPLLLQLDLNLTNRTSSQSPSECNSSRHTDIDDVVATPTFICSYAFHPHGRTQKL